MEILESFRGVERGEGIVNGTGQGEGTNPAKEKRVDEPGADMSDDHGLAAGNEFRRPLQELVV